MKIKQDIIITASLLAFMGALFALAMTSGKNHYDLSEQYVIPEKNKEKYAETIKNIVSAATMNNVGGDPEDVLADAKRTAYEMYAEPTMMLCKYNHDNYCMEIPHLTTEQVYIRDSLIKVHTAKKNSVGR